MTDPIPPNSASPPEDAEDLRLVAFLKANRPPVPAPHPDAEAKLMQAIAQTQSKRRAWGIKRSWMIAAIAFTAALIGSVLWQLRPDRSGVFAQRELELEAFMLETWNTASDPDDSIAELEWLSPSESISEPPPASQSLVYQFRSQESYP